MNKSNREVTDLEKIFVLYMSKKVNIQNMYGKKGTGNLMEKTANIQIGNLQEKLK